MSEKKYDRLFRSYPEFFDNKCECLLTFKINRSPGWYGCLLECCPLYQKVGGSILGQGAYVRQPINISLSP